MGIGKKNFLLNPKDVARQTGLGSIMAGDNLSKATNNVIRGGLDPHGLVEPLDERPKWKQSTSALNRETAKKAKEKKRKQYYKAAGMPEPAEMKRGGRTKAASKPCCRGMGAAIRGGRYRKDG